MIENNNEEKYDVQQIDLFADSYNIRFKDGSVYPIPEYIIKKLLNMIMQMK